MNEQSTQKRIEYLAIERVQSLTQQAVDALEEILIELKDEGLWLAREPLNEANAWLADALEDRRAKGTED